MWFMRMCARLKHENNLSDFTRYPGEWEVGTGVTTFNVNTALYFSTTASF